MPAGDSWSAASFNYSLSSPLTCHREYKEGGVGDGHFISTSTGNSPTPELQVLSTPFVLHEWHRAESWPQSTDCGLKLRRLDTIDPDFSKLWKNYLAREVSFVSSAIALSTNAFR